LRGIDSAVVVSGGDPQSSSRGETFPMDIDDDELLKGELIKLVDRAAGDLREDDLLARTVTVRLRDHDFTDRQASRTLEGPVLSDRAILRVARELLQRLRKSRPVPARLLGVALSSLVREDGPAQLSLLPAAAERGTESEKDRAVARVVDKLREKLGDEAIALGRKPTHRRR
jgi:DNA polymerase-4